jgi:hypothetical protein
MALFNFFEKCFLHGEKISQSRPMVTKNSEKSRFSTTSLRKIILDVFLIYGLKLRDTKIHKNVEYCESKFSLFVVQKLIWNGVFWPKTYENTVFSKFWSIYCLGCQYSHRKIVERPNMHPLWHKQAPQARAAYRRGPWIVSVLKKFNM